MRVRVLAVFAALMVVGCTSTSNASDTVTVAAHDDYTFTPRVVTVPSDTAITFTFTTDGMAHTYVVKDAIQNGPIDVSDGLLTQREIGSNDLIVAEAQAGETVTTTFTMISSGLYLVYCKLPGHRDNGMFATLIVE